MTNDTLIGSVAVIAPECKVNDLHLLLLLIDNPCCFNDVKK
jgi:hypothetical protein